MKVTRWERIVWAAQRVGWVMMGAILIAGLLGVLGGGGLSRRTIQAGDDAVFTYERVMRLETPRALSWTAVPRNGRVLVDWAGGGCLELVTTGLAPDRIMWEGAIQRLEFLSTAAGPVTVAMEAKSQRAGRCDVRTRMNDGAWLARGIIVLP
jgi:hypothetical protein